MDAVKYLREHKRICDKYEDCDDCPMSETNNRYGIICGSLNEEHPEEAVAIVEKWSAENPIKTRQSEFLKLHPNAKINSSGALAVCPLHIDTGAVDICNLINLNNTCEKCRKKYWLAEVSDE